MNAAIDIDRLIPAWHDLQEAAPIGHIESEADYDRITAILDRLLDVVRDDSTHPLYPLITLIGDVIAAYEVNLEPLDC